MKAAVYDLSGKKKSEVSLPSVFSTKIREDISAKYFEADKFIQPYAPAAEAGRRHSAAGTISHKRHDWKGHYGKGISRMPRKTMWRRGTQFMWIGAEVSSARGGRRAHPPNGIGREKKMNKKEAILAINSAIAATAHEKYVTGRYERLTKLNFQLPLVVEGKDNVKTKEFMTFMKNVLGEANEVAVKVKERRSGKGKMRGRNFKSNAGMLLVKGKDEKIKVSGIEVKNAEDIKIADLYPLGRLTMYTEKALSELGGKK